MTKQDFLIALAFMPLCGISIYAIVQVGLMVHEVLDSFLYSGYYGVSVISLILFLFVLSGVESKLYNLKNQEQK
jgi:hypothetical protein